MNRLFNWALAVVFLMSATATAGAAGICSDCFTGNYEYTVGVTWQFGHAKAVPAAAVTAPTVAPLTPTTDQAAPGGTAPLAGEAPITPAPAAEPTPERYKYCITLHIESDIDRAQVRPEHHEEIAKVGDFMNTYPTTTAVIEGHTDDVGTAEYNQELSQRRAESVVRYLVEKFGIDRSRLSAIGYGMSRPAAGNKTDERRQKNRRVEAIIDCAFDVRMVTPPEKFCMQLKLEFDTGSANIRAEDKDEIARVAEYMNRYPTATAVIEGHTDNAGGFDFNMKLSQQRAESVVNYLVDNFGIDRSRLSAKGYGYTRRIAYNNTPEGRQKNRRINAIIDCALKR